jgi:hypothetical protein
MVGTRATGAVTGAGVTTPHTPIVAAARLDRA